MLVNDKIQNRIVKIIQGKCSCSYTDKTGIPCQHLCAVINKFGNSFLKYFKARWINDGIKKNERRIPRTSRRNIKRFRF